MKKILILLVIILSCKGKSVSEKATISLDNFEEYQGGIGKFQENNKNIFTEFNQAEPANNKHLIILNYPFLQKDNYDILVYWNNKLVFQKSKSKFVNPKDLESYISPKIYIIHNSKVYRFETKGGFNLKYDYNYFYLVFCPTNDEDYSFNIIPSNEEIE